MFSTYGYMMSEEHGKDIELLLDILKEYGLNFERKNNYYYMVLIAKRRNKKYELF